jgi:hypothetical protein
MFETYSNISAIDQCHMNEQMNHSERPSSPYVGLLPYTEKDVAFFFGREADTEIVASNLRATKLTLVYGGSGVGKSSLLNAGVAHQLRAISESTAQKKGAPEFIVAIFREWIGDPVVGLSNCVQEAVAKAIPDLATVKTPPTRDLSQMLANWRSLTGASFFIILDQFEEYFLRPEKSAGEGSFAFEFPRAIARTDSAVRFLISMRDDAVAKLDFFKGSIPGLFDNRLQIKHLDKKAAENAIRKPIAMYNKLYGTTFEVEDELVRQVLKDVEVSKMKFSAEGHAGVGEEAEQGRIETPYLQLVMSRIWEKENEKDLESKTLRLETLTRELGGSQKVIDTHLDDVMNALPKKRRKLAAKFVHFTVTRYGTKIAADAATLADWAELPGKESEIEEVFDQLSTGPSRIYRRVTLQTSLGVDTESKATEVAFFEIFHDALIPALLSWRKRYVEARDKKLTQLTIKREEVKKRRQILKEEGAKRQRLIKISVLIASAILLVAGVVSYLQQTRYSKAEARKAQLELDLQKAKAKEIALALDLQIAKTKEEIEEAEAKSIIYEEDIGYFRFIAEILEYLSSGNEKLINVALSRLQRKAKDNALLSHQKDLFISVINSLNLDEERYPAKKPTLDALENSKPPAARKRVKSSFILLRIHYQDPSQQDEAERVKARLENEKSAVYPILVLGAEYVGIVDNVKQTVLCYFYKSDRSKAIELRDVLKAIGIKAKLQFTPGYESTARPSEFELWFSPNPISISGSQPE